LLAADKGHEEVVRLLIEKGADVNAKNNEGEAALHLAARNEHALVARLLIAGGADVNLSNDTGSTVLH
ncbi:ankyrin, partial [Glonium stellatum]